MADLTGKTALVTGASRGIGRAIAQRLAADGARVVVHYGRNDAAAEETVAAIEQKGGRAVRLRAELGVPGDVDRLFAELSRTIGDCPIDILVNNAAVFSAEESVETIGREEFERIFAINVTALFFLTQRALSVLTDGGRIINVSTGATWFAIPQVAYAMSKGAVDVFSRSLAKTLGPRGITVNSVSPGISDTDMNPWIHTDPEAVAGITAITALGRVGRPADIADAVAFLASDDARWITGQVLDVNGGLLLGPPD